MDGMTLCINSQNRGKRKKRTTKNELPKQETKDAFTTPSIVEMFSWLLTQQQQNPLNGSHLRFAASPLLTEATKDAFATPATVAMFSLVAPRKAFLFLSAAICNVTNGATQMSESERMHLSFTISRYWYQ